VKPFISHAIIGVVVLAAVSISVSSWTRSADRSLKEAAAAAATTAPEVPVAAPADDNYCSVNLKQILRRVLTSCGLVKAEGGASRGCQPLEAKTVAAMSGNDFNALFSPLQNRASIIQFEVGKSELDDAAKALLEKSFADRRGASYFFVVSRASPEGDVAQNRKLSEARAAAVLGYLKTKFDDPDLEKEVGLLWLGEEFAQLDQAFCSWTRSHPEKECKTDDLNRSAFIAWIDCRL
jgi:outer membrane protein OmpA-like peptidoglycan-associated protein